MQRNYLLFWMAGLLLSCMTNPESKISMDEAARSLPDTVKDGVFIHITESYGNPQRLLMPLKMATLMADNKDVLVYW